MYRIIITTTEKDIEIPIKDEETIKILNEIDCSQLTGTEFYDNYISSYIKDLCSVIIERDFNHEY
jgi:hypothetical protein